MNNNLFNRLASGDSFLENAYSQENLEKQARQLAQQQVKAVQGVAHQQLAQAIGESGVEAAVGAAGIAYPFVKKYAPEFADRLPSMQSLPGIRDFNVSNLRNSARELGERIAGRPGPTGRAPAPFTSQEIVNPAFDARAADVLPPAADEPAQSFRPDVISQAERDRLFSNYDQDFEQHIRDTGGQVARLQENIRGVPQAENVSPLAQTGRQPAPTYLRSDVERELSQKTQLLNQDRGAFAREEAQRAGVDPLDITEDRLKRLGATADPDIPQVSVPAGERAGRIAARRAARQSGIQEPELTEPQVMDPFQVGVPAAQAPKDWAQQAAENFPKATADYDPYQDVLDQDRMRQEREAMARDRAKYSKRPVEQQTDYDPVRPTEKAHLRSIKPAEPEPAGPAEITPAVPASELTGGIAPASLPEGAGFSRGGLKITAKREPAPPPEARPPIQQRGLQERAFEQDPEEDIRTGAQIEPESFTQEELFKPISINVPDEEPAAKLAAPEEEAPAAAPQEKPELQDLEKGETPKIPEPEVPKPDVVSEGKSLLKGVGESVEKELPEETGALELPAIGEVALAAVGIGQLISGLVDRHKEAKEEASQAAQMMQQQTPSVALDSSPTFDSTFR